MKTLILLLCTGLLGPLLTPGRADDSDDSSPFKVTLSCESQGSPSLLKISLHVPPEHYLYAAKLHFELDGATVTPTLPAPKEVQDQFSGQKKLVYDADFSGELLLAA